MITGTLVNWERRREDANNNTILDQIFRAVMPEEFLEFPSSFTQIGHIAHINLRDEYHPWKHLIGQVILDVKLNGIKIT